MNRFLDRTFLGLLACLLVATLGVNAMPVLVGAVVAGLHLNAANAGLMASLELGAVAFATLAISARVSRYRLARLGLAGAMLAVAGNLSCWLGALVPADAGAMLALNGQDLGWAAGIVAAGRMLAGLGQGVALAAFSAAIASVDEPDPTYARVLIANVSIIGLAIVALIPALQELLGLYGTFTALAVVVGVAAPCMRFLPSPAPVAGTSGRGALPNRRSGLLLIVSLSIFATGEGAVWAFVEEIGRGIEGGGAAAEARIFHIIGWASIAGVLVGAGAAAWLGLRLGRRLPLNAALLMFGLAGPLLSACTSHAPYVVLIGSFVLSQYFLFPYYMGAAAELDPEGRWAAASTGMYLLGSTVGPATAGQLVQWTHSYSSIGWLVLGTSLVPAAMMHFVLARR